MLTTYFHSLISVIYDIFIDIETDDEAILYEKYGLEEVIIE